MKYVTLLAVACLLLSNNAKADIILTAVTANPSPFDVGSPVNLNVFVRSTVAGGQLIDGIDMNINAATTANGAGTGAAGVFGSGSTLLLGGTAFDLASAAGQAFSTNFQLGGSTIAFADGIGNNLGTLYGSLTLNTNGVAPGTYFFNFDSLAANNPNTGPIVISGVGTAFTLVPAAVPEPSSLALMGLATAGFAAWRRRRAR